MSMTTAVPDPSLDGAAAVPDIHTLEPVLDEACEETEQPNSDEDDPVVHELDVYIAKSLGKLVLAQYPLRPTYKPYQNIGRQNVRMRPVQNELEIEMVIQKNANVPQQVQKLVVSQRPLIKPNSAIGLLKGKELHLTPLESIIQLTPSFDHIDKRVEEDAKMVEEKTEAPAVVQSITRKFTKVETERDKELRLSSYDNIQQERQREMWVPCDYRAPEHPYSAGQKRAMLCKKSSKGVVGAELTKREYLDLLIPELAETQYKAPPLPCTVVGLSELKKLSVEKQVETVLRNAKVISYKQLCSILQAVPRQQILKELQKIAYLIQGYWVITSEVLYPKGTKSALTGAPAELIGRHRDFIMWAFSQSDTIKRENLMSISKIDPEEVTDILKQVSVLKPYVGWTFKKPYDSEFEFEYPDIVTSESVRWSRMYEELHTILHLKNHKANPILENRTVVGELSIEPAVAAVLTQESALGIISKLDMGDVVDVNMLVELSNKFQDLIGRTVALYDDVIDHMTLYIPHDQCRTVLEEMCEVLAISTYKLANQDGTKLEVIAYNGVGEVSDKLRSTVFQLFEKREQISKSDIKEAVQERFSCSLTNKEYQSITTQLCFSATKCKSGYWCLLIKDTGS